MSVAIAITPDISAYLQTFYNCLLPSCRAKLSDIKQRLKWSGVKFASVTRSIIKNQILVDGGKYDVVAGNLKPDYLKIPEGGQGAVVVEDYVEPVYTPTPPVVLTETEYKLLELCRQRFKSDNLLFFTLQAVYKLPPTSLFPVVASLIEKGMVTLTDPSVTAEYPWGLLPYRGSDGKYYNGMVINENVEYRVMETVASKVCSSANYPVCVQPIIHSVEEVIDVEAIHFPEQKPVASVPLVDTEEKHQPEVIKPTRYTAPKATRRARTAKSVNAEVSRAKKSSRMSRVMERAWEIVRTIRPMLAGGVSWLKQAWGSSLLGLAMKEASLEWRNGSLIDPALQLDF